MFSQETEYFTLRDILSDKLLCLIECHLLPREMIENMFDDILFKLLENHVHTTDDMYMNEIISREVCRYTQSHGYPFWEDMATKVFNICILHTLTDNGAESVETTISQYNIDQRMRKERRGELCLY